jgi:hypothetical protein
MVLFRLLPHQSLLNLADVVSGGALHGVRMVVEPARFECRGSEIHRNANPSPVFRPSAEERIILLRVRACQAGSGEARNAFGCTPFLRSDSFHNPDRAIRSSFLESLPARRRGRDVLFNAPRQTATQVIDDALMIDVINHFEFRDGNRVLRNRAALSAATIKAEGQRWIGVSSLDDLHAGTAFLKNPTMRLLDTF